MLILKRHIYKINQLRYILFLFGVFLLLVSLTINIINIILVDGKILFFSQSIYATIVPIYTLIIIAIKPPRKGLCLYLRGFKKTNHHDTVKNIFQSKIYRTTRILSIYHGETNPVSPTAATIISMIIFIPLLIPFIASIIFSGSILAGIKTPGIWRSINMIFVNLFSFQIFKASDIKNLEATLRKIQRLTNSKFSSFFIDRLTKNCLPIETTDEFWKKSVIVCAKSSDAIIIDISSPGHGVLWELNTCAKYFPEKLLVISDSIEAAMRANKNTQMYFNYLECNSIINKYNLKLIAATSGFFGKYKFQADVIKNVDSLVQKSHLAKLFEPEDEKSVAYPSDS